MTDPGQPDAGHDGLLAVAGNLSRYHREHEKYYAEAALADAVSLQRTARALTALAERWAYAEPAAQPAPSPFAGTPDLNDERAIETSGVLFMEGEGEPAEITRIKQHGVVAIGGHVIPAIGLAAGKGPLLSPTLLQGRPPGNKNEIVLGTSTLRQIGRQVGQTVTMTVSGHPLRVRIVGRAVFPNFGQGSFTPTDLGQGAETAAAVLQSQAVPPGAPPGFQFVLLSFTPGPGRAANIVSF